MCPNHKYKTKLIPILFFSLLNILPSCKKLIEVKPPYTSTNAENVYASDGTAISVLTDIYAEMSNQNQASTNVYLSTLSWDAGLAADELTLFYLNFPQLYSFYTNDLTSATTPNYWNSIYPIIFISNSAIEGLNNSKDLTPAIKSQLIGEAKFVRAFCYFYLVNMYGDVPLVLATNYKSNAQLSRTPKSDVYQQIISDLIEAKNLLSDKFLKSDLLTNYLAGSEERVRPTKWAASALLARVYLFTGKFAQAEIESTAVINSSLFGLVTLNSAFLKNNKESIWQLQPVGTTTNSNTGEGKMFVLPSTGPANNFINPVYLNNRLVTSFESGDQRFNNNWVSSVTFNGTTYYFANKYKVGNFNQSTSEYITVFRLAEQLLIRAEARAQQDNLPAAIDDLDKIRGRAGLPLIATINPAISKTALLDKILHERQVELFTEWGHRWFDLKRTNTIDATMSLAVIQKGATWSSYKALWPIPQTEINLNPNLIQNAGY
jgi:starch-binding outer membrane protein, SusD/RagB family